MEISECFNKKCCMHRGCRAVPNKKKSCIHGIVVDGKLEIKHGHEIYKMIDNNHPLYNHFFTLNDPDYLKQQQLDREEQCRIMEEKQKQLREDYKRQQEEERLASNYNNTWSVQDTVELKIRRV